MALTGREQSVLALHRFGLGPRPSSVTAIASDPRGALLAELDRPGAGLAAGADLQTSAQAFRAVADANAERQARQVLALRRQKEMERREAEGGSMGDGMPESAAGAAPAAAVPEPTVARDIFLKEVKARVDAARAADIGFVERLVWFWSNHFCISANKIGSMAGGYEREAIRPNVLGPFAAMLLAAESHPAMLFYLDNAGSMGPNSIAGLNRNRGLNENLAREILELHTLGVAGGYTQDDVVAFAKVLTGWTFLPAAENLEHGGEFVFNRRLHEPGPQTVLGRVYADNGLEQGRAVLRDLARHPATATHLASKLACHFVADEPPPPLVARLARTFKDTDGDLKQMARALVAAPEAWSEKRVKLKRPSEWVMAIVRATASAPEPARFLGGQALLGEPVWRPPSPKGHPDVAAAWIDGLGRRLDIASNVAQRIAGRVEPASVLEQSLGALASAETRTAVARAETRQQALALVFMSPEFQRR
jgi:uncharacterized protein (DUF1800 family)